LPNEEPGTINDATKLPPGSVELALKDTGRPPRLAFTEVEARNPTTLNVTVEPTTPLEGLKLIVPKA